MTADLHSHATAGPMPATSAPPGAAQGEGPPATERPEVQAGLAFAGGLLAAKIIRRLTR